MRQIIELIAMNKKWDGFIKEISNLLFFWFFGIVFFFASRITFILIYHKALGENIPFKEYLASFLMGFRFDSTAIAYFIIFPFIATLLLSCFSKFDMIRKIRIIWQYLFIILSSLICIIAINYYRVFNDQFNNFVFLGLHDDKGAILKTIVEYYHPVLNTFFFIVVVLLSIWILKRFENGNRIYAVLSKINSKYAHIGLIIALTYLFVAGIRGTFTNPPAIRKWAFVSTDAFLNKAIINPYRALKYAYEDYKELNEIGGDNPFEKDIHLLFNEKRVSDIIKKEAKGAAIEKPKQIFLIIMESYDSWPLMEKYLPFGFSKNLNDIAHKGTHFSYFLPSYHATFYAYGTIVGGIPYNGVNISRLATISDTYITSIFTQFKELGYKTNMFYGGFLSWENIGNFTKHMGCETIYSGAEGGGKSESGAWGIEDEKLFDLVLKHIDKDEYSFNVIMTSSYHEPYSVDVNSKGFIYKSKNQFPEEVKPYEDGRMNLIEMGHLWYGDWAIGRFINRAEKKYENSMFAFTGDHYGRRFINHSPNLYEESSVPFILYGKNIPKGQNKTPGSHIDIAPTIIDLIAPEGFEYYSFGTSLFDPDKKIGIGFQKVIDENTLYFTPKDAKVSYINLNNCEEKQTDEFKYQEEYKKLMALSWHYIVKGDSLLIP